MITGDHLLNTTVEVERRETMPDGAGGQESRWEIVGELAARVAQSSPGEQVITAASVTRDLTHRVYFTAGADVVRGDRLVTVDGAVLAVESILEPSEPAYRRAQCVFSQDGR